jgi:hypothetical protein
MLRYGSRSLSVKKGEKFIFGTIRVVSRAFLH